jgi:undecaprenyl-diphosphatase
MRSQFLDDIMPFITKLGSGGFIWIITGLVFLKSKQYRMDGIMLLASLLLCGLFGNLLLKPLVGRIRPCDIHMSVPLLIARPTDYSFPSGHAMSSFAAANIIFHANMELGIAAYILAALIAFSRLYLYVHYPSDILAGIILGLFVSTSLILAVKLKTTDYHWFTRTDN